jgi:hypothetical protein
MARPLTELSDAELRNEIHKGAIAIKGYGYPDLVIEIDRRSRNRQAIGSFFLSAVGLGLAVVALIVTALKA